MTDAERLAEIKRKYRGLQGDMPPFGDVITLLRIIETLEDELEALRRRYSVAKYQAIDLDAEINRLDRPVSAAYRACYQPREADPMTRMTQKRIQEWLAYWTNAKMVAVDQINAFDQVHLARKYCSCMRVGVFSDVSDLAIWRALENMRSGKYPELAA